MPSEHNTKMLYGIKYALFIMPCDAGKIKRLVNIRTKPDFKHVCRSL